MLKLVLLFIFLSLLSCSSITPKRDLASTSAPKKPSRSCSELLRFSLSKTQYKKQYSDFSKFKINNFYKIILAKTKLIDDAQLVLMRKSESGENIYSFSIKRRSQRGNLTNEEIQLIEIPEHQISGFTKKSSADLKNIGFQDKDFLEYVDYLYSLYSTKLTSIIKKNKIEVLVRDSKYSVMAKKVHSIVSSHINFYDKHGFKAPSELQVILDHQGSQSPFAIPGKMSRAQGKKKYNTIILTALKENKNALIDESIIRHELTHVMLQEHFNKDSFINKSDSFQEALADFFSANITNSPSFVAKNKNNTFPIRNLETRTGKDKIPMNSLIEIEGNRYHDSSLVFSNILWNLRKILGDNINDDLLSLIDDLNSYYPSYQKHLSTTNKSHSNEYMLSSTIYDDMYFFISVLLKRSWKKEKEDEVYKFLESYIDINQLSYEKIMDYSYLIYKTKIDNDIAPAEYENKFGPLMQILIKRHKAII